jgi:GT2 family glycosyltransferase
MRTSLIIAAHNEGEQLLNTLESCVETAGALDYEIIVADDASTDGTPEAVARRFPLVRLQRQTSRQGASPTKNLGARWASGDIFIFLDGHTKPEHGALQQLVRDVEDTGGKAIITPRIAVLDVQRWQNVLTQVGHGYAFDLLTMASRWVPLEELQHSSIGRGNLFETPALIGCAFATSRDVYEKVWGFDAHMKFWGVEDLDFAFKCWLMGYPILHDPEIVVGHRFQEAFTNYSVPTEHILVNQLRMAYKNFTHAVWGEWLAIGRRRHDEPLPEHPEGLWARAWELFKFGEDSAKQERSYLHAHRTQDEFWYAGRFGLQWPQLTTHGEIERVAIAGLTPSHSPKPSPKPSPSPAPCRFSIRGPADVPGQTKYKYQIALGGKAATAISWSVDKGTASLVGGSNTDTVVVAFKNTTADWIKLRAVFTVDGKRECAEKQIALVKVTLDTPTFSTPGTCRITPGAGSVAFLVNPPSSGGPIWITTHDPGSACAAFTYNGSTQAAETANFIGSSLGGSGDPPAYKAVAKATLTAPAQKPAAIRQIQVGLIQSGQHAGDGTYDTVPAGKRRVITLPAMANIDWLGSPCSPGMTDEWPWYDQSVRGQPGGGDSGSWTKTFTLTDSPGAGLPAKYNPNNGGDPNKDKALLTATDHDDFVIRMAVRTRDTDLGADKHYFEEGHQTWSVNFSWPGAAGTPIVTTGPNSWTVPTSPTEINCNVVPSITLNVAPFRRWIPA